MIVRPHITLLFLLTVFTLMLVASVVIPEDGIRLTDNSKIRFYQAKDLFSKEEEYADISKIIAENSPLEVSLLLNNDADSMPIVSDTLRANVDSLNESVYKIQFPNHDKTLLYAVFDALEKAQKQEKVVRIMHFGDSQIEGDRMTSLLRNRLQNKFGGAGVGLVPASQPYDFSFSVFHRASDNWNRYTLYGKRDTLVNHNRYGILAGFSSFTPQPLTPKKNKPAKETAWISIRESPYAYKNTKEFEQCRLLYGYGADPFSVKIMVNQEIADTGTYFPSEGLKQIQWYFNSPVNNLYIELSGQSSPEVYGIALDAKSGVAVDNIAMRGSAGLVFSNNNAELFRAMVEKLDVKLIILQFGGNIVPNIRKDYSYYERWFYAQLKFIRENSPGVEIIVVGLSDMSQKVNNRYESYPNIESIRDAMKKASFRAGAAYWDMYEAMGGKNSMPSWVFAKPALASSDFVHFTPRGANIIANMFYNALLYEYQLYSRKPKSLPQ